MIVTFFDAGKGRASNATNYLFSEKDSNGNIRNPPAKLFMGDRRLTETLIDMNPSKGARYTSGVIAFRDDEKPSNQELKQIVKSFREVFCPGMGEDRVNMLFVRHEDKGNTEIHFLVVNQDMKSQRPFHISPAYKFKGGTVTKDKYAMQLERDFAAYWNDKLGYVQVVEDPLRAQFYKLDTKSNGRNNSSKERLSDEIAGKIRGGEINNRKELIDFLTQKNCQITRKGHNYLSVIPHGKTKAVRLSAGVFWENADYKEQVKIADVALSKTKLTKEEADNVEKSMNALTDYRDKLYKQKYTIKKRMPKPKSVKTSSSQQIKINNSPKDELQAKPSILPVSNLNSNNSNKQKNCNNNFKSVGISGISSSLEKIGSLESKILALGIQLLNAPISQRSQIEKQLAELKAQLVILQQQLIEKKKAELNKDNRDKFKY